MGYPNYPDNRIFVNGIDLTEKYGMILLDGYTISPPEPKTYSVDIPCSDGSLDLTEALRGRAVYKNRSMSFSFCILKVDNVELLKSTICAFLHGKNYNFRITMDPDYIYHGRFIVSDFAYAIYDIGKVVSMKIEIDADPYKWRSESYSFSAVGGVIKEFLNGNKLISPTITSGGNLKVIFNNRTIYINSKEWTSNSLTFGEGINELYFNSYEIHNLKWGDITEKSITWGTFKEKKLFEWYKSVGTVDNTLAQEVSVKYDWSGI